MTPKAIDILLDVSESMGAQSATGGKTCYARIVEYLNEVIRPGLDPQFAVGFCVFGGTGVQRVLPIQPRPTDELGDRVKAVAAQHSPHGTTPLADAISQSCDELAKVSALTRAIIVLSDGGENGSRIQLSAACQKARDMSVDLTHGGLAVFGVGIDQLDKELKKLSEDTKGNTLVVEAKAPDTETKAKLQDFMLDVATRDLPLEAAMRLFIAVELDRALTRHCAMLAETITRSMPPPTSLSGVEARVNVLSGSIGEFKTALAETIKRSMPPATSLSGVEARVDAIAGSVRERINPATK